MINAPSAFDDNMVFTALLVIAVIVSKTPLRVPFTWFETFFHEFSHGLAAFFTFGKIHRIQLKFNGAGVCTTSGGWSVPILLAGYLGASIWGALIYTAGWALSHAEVLQLFYFFMVLIVVCIVLWVRDFVTLGIMATMFVIFFLPVYFPSWEYFHILLEFIGIYVVLSAVQSPLYLIDGKHIGDGAMLADRLLLPEIVWVTGWFLFALATLYFLWMLNAPTVSMWILREVILPLAGLQYS